MGYTIGLDIGIASVGWAVVNEEYEIVEAGANIFPAAEPSSNVERRGFRQARRLKRRQKTRISDFEKLWEKSGFKVPNALDNDVLELRIKGLSERLTEDEMYAVLLNNLKHRGISYLEDAEIGNTSGEYAKSIAYNEAELEHKLPCEIQYERLCEYGEYRGNITTIRDGEPLTLRNVFTIGAYRKEVSEFLDKQIELNDKVNESFKEEYLLIFNRKREYYVGPGNELSRTDYGIYTTEIDEETGKYKTESNIFDKLIGKCSIYPDLRRAAGASYTAQEFNVLNDLNNLTINDRKLTESEKKEIIKTIKTSKTVSMKKIISKAMGESIETMSGARVDKSNKEIFHCFETYNKMRRALENIGKNIEDFTREELDELGEILTLNTDREAIYNEIRRRGLDIDDEIIKCLTDVRKNNGSLFSKWQSFSINIMLELIPEMYLQPKNQMQLLTDMGVFKTRGNRFLESNSIPAKEITKDIYNPVVSKSVRITIYVVNELIKKYGNPDNIVIEMPRDKNTDEQKKRLNDIQKNNEKELESIIDKVKKEYGKEITEKDFKQHNKLKLKLKLWNEQNGICPYSGKKIDIEDLLNNPFKFEVDHIIPLSISFDDSRANKVLVYASENQDKKNCTPIMYLSGVNREWGIDEYRDIILKMYSDKKISTRKRDNFLFSEDITKIDVLKGFIARNINDTRYASKVVLNSLQEYFGIKNAGTKVKVINGGFTHQMRVNLRLEKDRDESYSHHAVDAMLIAFSQMGYDAYQNIVEDYIDFETGEFIDRAAWEKMLKDDKVYTECIYQDKWMRIKQGIADAEKKVKYWYQIDKKCNRSLCDQTIYGTRKIDNVIYKINRLDIRTDAGIKTFKAMVEKGKEKNFLMYRNDPNTFEQLMAIYNEYSDAKNPFIEYEKATGDVVRKYSKKHNGPKVSILKYTDGEVGSCIDISHKYGFEKGSKKVVLDSLKPFRMDVYYNQAEKSYYLVGVKQSDIKCEGNKYIIDEDMYAKTLVKEKMIKEGQSRLDLEVLGFEYKLSFYKNDLIEYEKDGQIYMERFLSRTMPNQRNYIETKPANSSKFEKRNLVGLSKTYRIRKITTDILGNRYYVDKENFCEVISKKEF